MIDLWVLVADSNIKAAVEGLLSRPEALGIRRPTVRFTVHPQRDPGCFNDAAGPLRVCVPQARHGLVVLDREFDGSSGRSAAELEGLIEGDLAKVAPADWGRAVVIDPELEIWVFADSPHVAEVLGFGMQPEHLRNSLAAAGLWSVGDAKPLDPKKAVEWALRSKDIPRSSSVYRELAKVVGLGRCQDRAFLRLRSLLREWLPLS